MIDSDKGISRKIIVNSTTKRPVNPVSVRSRYDIVTFWSRLTSVTITKRAIPIFDRPDTLRVPDEPAEIALLGSAWAQQALDINLHHHGVPEHHGTVFESSRPCCQPNRRAVLFRLHRLKAATFGFARRAAPDEPRPIELLIK